MPKLCRLIGIAIVLASLGAGPARGEPPSDSGLAAYWDFDEPAGFRVIDRAGGDHPGTLASTARSALGPFASRRPARR
jgi:hypothetical protein